MSIFQLQCFAALLIWTISIVGGSSAYYLIKRLKRSDTPHLHAEPHTHHSLIHLAEGLAGGVFLGAALFHMLPDAQSTLKQIYPNLNYPFANLICAFGFCVLLILETVTHYYDEQKKQKSLNLVPILLTLLISIHALSEGIALGINQQTANIIIIFIAIAAHKSSEAFAVGLQLQKGTLSTNSIFLLFLLFSIMSPLGVLLGSFSHYIAGRNSGVWSGVFNAFAAGTFLYLATLHKLHHAHEHSKLGELFFTLLGLALMAVVAIWV
jgi:zinc transporter 1/2/3